MSSKNCHILTFSNVDNVTLVAIETINLSFDLFYYFEIQDPGTLFTFTPRYDATKLINKTFTFSNVDNVTPAAMETINLSFDT
jgi:hypothetical protein